MLTGVSINNVATYNEPNQLNNLKKINFIFGSNGSGKTTISRILEQAPGYTHCSLQWGGGLPLKTVVYNRDFIERNFNQANPVRGVFTLGDDQVEAERQIALLRPQIDKLTRDIQRLKGQLDGDGTSIGKKAELVALESNLQSKCWRQKQDHDSYFQEAFTGYRNNAERFKQRVLSERQSNNAALLTLEELKEKALTVFSEDVFRYNSITGFDASYLIQAESNEILQKVIVGNQDVNIAKLIERLGNSDWVKQGLTHYEKSSPNCPFCQQATPITFFDELNNFFSEIYDQEIKVIEDLSNQYMRVSNSLISTIEAISNQSNPFLQADMFHAESQTLKERIERNKSLLLKKLAEPSLKITLEPIEPIVTELLALISKANVSTSEHNQIVQNIDTEKRVLTSQVWKYILHELDNDLNEYEQQNSHLEAAINGMTESQRRKTQEIAELQRQIKEYEQRSTSILPTVNDINSLLRSFGFTSFKIDPVDEQGHYKICRANGDDASRSLSEGEKTFITFLYFYSLIKGSHSASGITENRIVVFDDPISSLDSDILYIVSTLIKRIFDDVSRDDSLIKQVFVLTHNVYFHKEISYRGNRSQNQIMSDETFWMVKKTINGSIVEQCTENPIRSAYELLWSEIRAANSSSLTIQNTLRRLLENYFTMWGGKTKDDICNLFEGNDKLICQSLFSWVNDGSHCIHDDLYINHGQQTNESYLRVFKEIFEKAGHINHYNMMVS
ncbi:AAA family ATPase [Acinetobacter variabilis]|uniref:AAA family ATPase n=1 Tax=Acinetobacter variabilis TaxID=70346 RepID=UPI0028A124B7|nr:AAA family ATPase [Acinetobacter variabilis]